MLRAHEQILIIDALLADSHRAGKERYSRPLAQGLSMCTGLRAAPQPLHVCCLPSSR